MRASSEKEDQVRGVGEEAMLLAEMVHRTANEASSALAAIHLVGVAKGSRTRRRLLDQATARLEGFAAINSALAVSFERFVDVARVLDRLAQSIASGRGGRAGRVVLDLQNVSMEPAQARRMLLVAYELISNAVRHVIEVHGGLLSISLRYEVGQVLLVVSDDGPGLAACTSTSGTGLGGRLVTDLVRCAAGRLECVTGEYGTNFRVLVPTSVPDSTGIIQAG